ncbi:MAG: hypothetical protein RIR11_1048 [Bacteroidota bacterium]
MPHTLEIVLPPEHRENEQMLRLQAARSLRIAQDTIVHTEILRASLDARGKHPVYRLRTEVYVDGEIFTPESAILDGFRPVDGKKGTVIIVGAGPAGYFAALELIELGIKPIVLDRGKDARARRRDLKAIQQYGEVNPHSNYCFGEGGAGTYSDGKLYTRSLKRGVVQKSLRLLVEHGAKSDILTEAHPHIGSNKLPEVVQNIRATIEQYGGEVHFDQFVVDFILHQQRMEGVVTQYLGTEQAPYQKEWRADAVILATGHSARDIYTLCFEKGIKIEAKPFALGVRVEHPQPIVDAVQYRQMPRSEHLPAASYSLVCQVRERGVFSFCMCPGGLVVPAATAPGEIVVNGMSMSRRDSPYANSGVVTAIEPEDMLPWAKHGVFAHMEFQAEVERNMFRMGDGSQKAPALRLTDFISGKLSASLPKSSYIPGLFPAPLYELLPPFVYKRLRDGLSEFGKMMKGYYTAEANVIGTESRTSSPVRIPRDPLTYQHVEIMGLYPCGEGAGYAGGIISAAMDGQNVARAVVAGLG